ncbi:unnamed protein product, partial [Mesorhabditis belari]|uniref:Uncharacterized protein n=1 Tax=Mesorhabditis belari TaxID=2138241 RepID=A0AAF3EHQ0_9BILA
MAAGWADLPGQFFDTVIASETIYNTSNYEAFHLAIDHSLKEDGVALMNRHHSVQAAPVIINYYPHITDLTPMIILSSLDSLTYFSEQGFLMAIATNRLLHMCTRLRDDFIYRVTIIQLCGTLPSWFLAGIYFLVIIRIVFIKRDFSMQLSLV